MNRSLRLLLGVALLSLPNLASAQQSPDARPDAFWVYVGTYTQPNKSKGVYLFKLDAASGRLEPVGLAGEITNPSFLAIHPGRKFLYTVGELNNFQGKKEGAVSAFAIDPATGKLSLLNQQPSGGEGPCFVSTDKTGKVALVANYGGGSVESLPIAEDGKLEDPASVIRHEGSSVTPRQKKPFAHSINVDKENRFAFAADLGADRIFVYRLDTEKGTLTPNDPPSASLSPGSGPRHFAFHPDGKHAYVINELSSTVTAFSYDPAKGQLSAIQTLSTLPAGADAKALRNSTAEVQVHPSGKFVYGSNRGHDSIAVFAVDGASGKLTPVEHESTQGKTPRNFGIDPTGTWLIAANQQSDSLVVFRIDARTGELTPTGQTLECFAPVCVKFMPAPK